ncbi:MAG TPA: hypothetical protein PLU17_01605 [Chitinophagaceae bacterium]|nr:hypothetical protein [Chitinophagaceae bacterium]
MIALPKTLRFEQSNKIANTIYLLLVIVCLVQIWLPTYFVTGDGPCHIYNASILKDMILDQDESFYHSFYTINYQVNANWVSHVLLAFLLFFFKAAIAEKIILSTYILLFCCGFFKLVSALQGRQTFMILMIPLFVFSSLVLSGFYNFVLSMSLLPWLIYLFLKYIDTRRLSLILPLIILTFIAYLSHPMSVMFLWITEFIILLFYIISKNNLSVAELKKNLVLIGSIVFSNLPAFLLMFIYLNQQETFTLTYNAERWNELKEMKILAIRSSSEYGACIIAGKIFIALMIAAVIYFKKSTMSFAFLTISLVSLFIYLYFPDMLLNGGVFIFRVQWILYLFLVCWMATIPLPQIISFTSGILFSVIFIYLSAIRIPVSIECSNGIEDYLPALNLIENKKTLLPLTFEKTGVNNKGSIADICWVYQHGLDYLGSEKKLIIMDNYEGTTTNFPLKWKSFDPFHIENLTGIEGIPPYADIDQYHQHTNLDYIITWYYNPTKHNDSASNHMMSKIKSQYTKIFVSESQQVNLYKRNH